MPDEIIDQLPDLFAITIPEAKLIRMTPDGTVIIDWQAVDFMAQREPASVETHFARFLIDASNGLVKRP